MINLDTRLEFVLPEELIAHEPPEARGLPRDGVRLMVSRLAGHAITHTTFPHLPEFVRAGDVLLINTSATIPAAFTAVREKAEDKDGDVELHLSTPLSERRWVIELRRLSPAGTSPLLDAQAGERLRLPAGGTAVLIDPYLPDGGEPPGRGVRLWIAARGVRLWIADLRLPEDALAYAARHGTPIRYAYVPKSWPLSYYQNVFAREPGSVEMPSAGRAFTQAMLDRLARGGVQIAPLTLHTGVSSLEADEPPYPERYTVPDSTARAVNAALAAGSRIIAVGTTSARAIETVASEDGRVRSGSGWTDLVISPQRGLRVVDSMLTGLHGPTAPHLAMLEALAGPEHMVLAYESALSHRYLWHEFGDLHLILADGPSAVGRRGLPFNQASLLPARNPVSGIRDQGEQPLSPES